MKLSTASNPGPFTFFIISNNLKVVSNIKLINVITFIHNLLRITGNKIMGRQAAGWSFLKAIIQSQPPIIGTYIKNLEQRNFFKDDVQNILKKDERIDIKWIPYDKPYLS